MVRLGRTLILALLAVLLPPTVAIAGSSAPSPAYAHIYAYDTTIHLATQGSSAPEPGPPVYAASASDDAADRESQGISTRPKGSGSRGYTPYDHDRQPAWDAAPTSTSGGAGVAAKAAPDGLWFPRRSLPRSSNGVPIARQPLSLHSAGMEVWAQR